MQAPFNCQEIVMVENVDFSYPIYIGADIMRYIGSFAESMIQAGRYSGCIVIADENVQKLYGAKIAQNLGDKLRFSLTLPAGESTKAFGHLQHICEEILQIGIDRQTLIIALGGGVIGDLAGFAASILLRGIPFIQVPTSLLAMVDSSVGGKTGINSASGKNLIGSFYQPDAVLIDTGVLSSLPCRQFNAGYAEVVKYAFINDATFFAWLIENKDAIFSLNVKIISQMIKTCCAQKAAIVAADEKEKGARALLNLGHTFGHALEAENNYGPELLHGEAVAIGMVLAFEFSCYLRLCPQGDVDAVRDHIKAVGLPAQIQDIKSLHNLTAEKMLKLMFKDKKVKQGRLRLILTKGIGKSFIAEDIDIKSLQVFLESKCAFRA